MPSENTVPFLDMFPCCGTDGLSDYLKGGEIIDCTVDKNTREINMRAKFSKFVPPVYISEAERVIAGEFSLRGCRITPVFPDSAAPENKKTKPKSEGPKPIFGRIPRGNKTPMSELNIDSGKVIVEGKIFADNSRDIAKANAFVLSIDVTDGTDSVRVNQFIKDPDTIAAVKKLSVGMNVTVYGTMTMNRFDGEVLEPRAIATAPAKKPRTDDAPEKRVELHLHTRYSTMDALTDPKAVIDRAVAWGHPAIAITDHGVCQAFPDAMKAAGDKIKVVYGVEGYYINDVDDKVTVSGTEDMALPGTFVAFDIETTGLNSQTERIIEIGAVLFKDGKSNERFQTFVDPEKHIPLEITRLTGITDDMIEGAPDEKTAVKSFLEFSGGLPLVAHNANFDIGFIDEAAKRHGLDFTPTFIDTVALSQAIQPQLKNHKLDTVALALELPDFEHHRASDDALTCGLIAARYFDMMVRDGVSRLSEVNAYVLPKRKKAAQTRRLRPMHIIVLAKNQTGIKNLYRIVTKSHLEFLKRNPIMPKSLLMEYREGLIIGSACEAGEVFQSVVEHRSRAEQRRLASFYDYLEIQPICNNAFMLRGEKPKAKNEEELRDLNRRIVELGDELGKMTVATGDVHFLDPEDEIFRHILLTAKEFEDADKPLPIYFRTTDEMLEEFSYFGDRARELVITNPNKIADMVESVRPLPPAGKLFAPKIENSEEELKSLVYGRMHELYGENPPDIVKDRVEQELHDILSRHYYVIYMSAQKLVHDSLEHGYLVGSRGSVGSSIVAFMSGITEVNSLPPHYRCPKCKNTEFILDGSFGCGADMPDKICPVCGEKYDKDGFDIPFETFLGFGGDKVPDIDLNFSGEYQANAHRYTTELFGPDHVFRAGTIGTVAEKTAFGYVKKCLEKTGKTKSAAEMNRLALGCVGVKRTTGQHPGGLVVIPQDMEIADFCPAQHPADDEGTDIITTHFEYHCMEDNLLKLDELGHDDPTMIKMLEDMTGVNARKIPLDDPETMGIFKSAAPLGLTDDDPIIGKTGSIGIPEFGTGFTRQMLVDTKPERFDTLVRLSGFSHGTDVWLGNAKDLIVNGIASVNETVGCRDDIMLFLISKGLDPKMSFKIMEAVRKGKVKKGGFQDGWVDAMKSHGVPDWYIESLSKIAYLFPKAHAVAYVMMAFRIAWFKVHEPAAFYSAYFYRRSQKDSFDAEIMTQGDDIVLAKIKEIRENENSTAKDDDLLTTLEACHEFYMRGFTFEPIDLYESDAVKFKITERGLRPPFVAISGLGETAARDIVEQRKLREFVSIEELGECCPKVSKTHIEQLKALGALSGLPETSQMSLF
ncbi:MAG: PolC-type DNA polymerase III [Oscillospiraceae bacterium]|nr:PolC-type DNA polymerase III [Oscillospiraceae bacterium]